MTQPKLEILMATYNGEAWLEEQLESLFRQSCLDWKLYVQDDHSSDRTEVILRNWVRQYPDRIHYSSNPGRNGPAGNFSNLLQTRLWSGIADYYLFCDQDDVWDPQHVEILRSRLLGLESIYGKHTPCLVHSDLAVCDKELNTLNASFWEHQALNPRKNQLGRLLLQNVVTGCATGINRALAEKAGPVPVEAIMHDWWLALTATSFGQIEPIPQALVRYRIHGKNSCGTAARALSWANIRAKLRRGGPGLRALLQPYFLQADAFQKRFGSELSQEQNAILTAFCTLPQQSWLKRRRHIVRYGLWKQEWIRNVAWWLRA
jgi:glycosyltransferase involved in cell wall biosynthesis